MSEYTKPIWGEMKWGNFIWGDVDIVTGNFSIEGDELVLRIKLADAGKFIKGGTFELTPQVEGGDNA